MLIVLNSLKLTLPPPLFIFDLQSWWARKCCKTVSCHVSVYQTSAGIPRDAFWTRSSAVTAGQVSPSTSLCSLQEFECIAVSRWQR